VTSAIFVGVSDTQLATAPSVDRVAYLGAAGVCASATVPLFESSQEGVGSSVNLPG
jgi:hypothetical protein